MDTPANPDAPSFRPAPEPPPVAPPPPRWPEWFLPFDTALGVLAVVVAFLMGSFAARNPDLWRHLAAGKLVTQFQYPIGGDPFTYTAAERPWVNAHWLGEVVLYTLYSVDTSGAIAVGVKAIAFAAAVGCCFCFVNRVLRSGRGQRWRRWGLWRPEHSLTFAPRSSVCRCWPAFWWSFTQPTG